MSKSNAALGRIQASVDGVFRRLILPLTPSFITPNIISLSRLALIAPVIICLAGGRFIAALIIFIIAAALDAYDGALARYRKQYSDWGLILDPLADKLLVMGTLIILLGEYPFTVLLLAIIGLEIALMALTAIKLRAGGQPAMANIWGKSKMLLQIIGVALAVIWLIWPSGSLLYLSAGVLWLSLATQAVSIFTYIF